MKDLSELDDLSLVRQIQHGNELAMANPFFQMCLWPFIFLTLFWKALLLAITLRLAGNLNFIQIIQAIAIIGLLVLFYWWGGIHIRVV